MTWGLIVTNEDGVKDDEPSSVLNITVPTADLEDTVKALKERFRFRDGKYPDWYAKLGALEVTVSDQER